MTLCTRCWVIVDCLMFSQTQALRTVSYCLVASLWQLLVCRLDRVASCRYFTPEQALEYGIIDRIIPAGGDTMMDSKDYEGALNQMRSQQRGRGASSGGGPDASN